MKELTQEEMTSVRGGLLDTNLANVITAGNVALSIPIAINVLGDQDAAQFAGSAAGNQLAGIGQVA